LWHSDYRVLPKTRKDVYEECVKMLLNSRDEKRGVSHDIGDKLKKDEKNIIIEDIAYYYQYNDKSSYKTRYVLRRIDTKIQNMRDVVKDIEAEKILNYFVERSGILRNLSTTDIDFIHKTFQEYLAAKVIVANFDSGLLLKNIFDHTWNEVIMLAMEMATQEFANEIITHLLCRGQKDNRYISFAVAYFEIPSELSADLRTQVTNLIPDVIPPKNDEEATLLAKNVPQAIIPYLKFCSSYSADELMNCAKVLLAISTVQSLSYLKEYLSKFNCDRVSSYITTELQEFELQDIVDSGLSDYFLESAFAKDKSVATLSVLIKDLCEHLSITMDNKWDNIIINDAECFTMLEGIGKIRSCEWHIVYESFLHEDINTHLISINELVICLELRNRDFDISLRKLIGFGKIAQLTLVIDTESIEEVGVNELFIEDIKGLKKIHIISKNREFIFDKGVMDLFDFGQQKSFELEITAERLYNDISVNYSTLSRELRNISKLIINVKGVKTVYEGTDDIITFFERLDDSFTKLFIYDDFDLYGDD